jgi:hypothetical protein
MPLLPPPDNDYRGSPVALGFLWLLVAVNAFRGCVHFLWEDSGAGSIAGIDLSANGAVIVHMLAVIGIDQLVWGAIQAVTALRWRRWIPLVLLVTLVKQALGAFTLWVWKELPVAAPGKYGALVTLPLVALAFWLSLPRHGVAGLGASAELRGADRAG